MVRFIFGILILLTFALALLGVFIDPSIGKTAPDIWIIIIILFIPGYLLACFGWFAHSEKKRKERWIREGR